MKLLFNTSASLQILPTRQRRVQMLVFAVNFEASHIAVSRDLPLAITAGPL
jgi:ABC-type uncharacterized transport system YnjBCD ATPase subunit